MFGQCFARPVLVVDDDEATRSAERAVLTEDGFRVIEARDGAEAMRQIQGSSRSHRARHPDARRRWTRRSRASCACRCKHVPLVILTGVDDPKHEADRCNAEAFLSKPFNAPELVKVVRRFAT